MFGLQGKQMGEFETGNGERVASFEGEVDRPLFSTTQTLLIVILIRVPTRGRKSFREEDFGN